MPWGSEPGVVASELLIRLYSRFGMARADIPYIDPSDHRFSPERLIELEGPGVSNPPRNTHSGSTQSGAR